MELPQLHLLIDQLEAQRDDERSKAAQLAASLSMCFTALDLSQEENAMLRERRKKERWLDRGAGAGAGGLVVLILIALL